MSITSDPLGGVDLWERIHRTQPRPVPFPTTTGGHVVVFGYSLAESTGAAGARVDLFSGTDATGVLALPIPLGAGMGVEEWFGPQGLWFENGLFCRLTAGAVIGSIFLVERWDGPSPSHLQT